MLYLLFSAHSSFPESGGLQKFTYLLLFFGLLGYFIWAMATVKIVSSNALISAYCCFPRLLGLMAARIADATAVRACRHRAHWH